MRFYYQDAGEKVSTKCIRVDSTASTEDVINVLIEKFRPDMKTLPSANDFAIYEIHLNSGTSFSLFPFKNQNLIVFLFIH